MALHAAGSLKGTDTKIVNMNKHIILDTLGNYLCDCAKHEKWQGLSWSETGPSLAAQQRKSSPNLVSDASIHTQKLPSFKTVKLFWY